MLVTYYSIEPSSSGFGEYDATADNEIHDECDLLNAIAGEVYELGSDDLPEWVEDIRGSIHNEPERVFVERSNDRERVTYFGLDAAE